MRSHTLKAFILAICSLSIIDIALAAGPQMGPIIKNYGPVMTPPEGAFNLAVDTHYKVSMDMGTTPEFPGDLNRHLVSAARFLNMSAQTGIPPEHVEFALIVHGKAVKDILTDAAHQARYNEANPNSQLLAELNAAGVNIYLCSQTSAFRGFAPEEFNPVVTMAVSAMTAHVYLQQSGYTLIPF